MAEGTWKDYESMTWLHYVVKNMPEHCIVTSACQNMKMGYVEWSTLYVLGLMDLIIKKLAMSWIMPSLAIVIANIINDCIWLYEYYRFNK